MVAEMESQLDKILFDDYFTLELVTLNSITHLFHFSIEQNSYVTVHCANA